MPINPTQAQATIQPAITVSAWLKLLDDDNRSSKCALNTEPFLDLADYLKSLPSDDSQKIYNGMFHAGESVTTARQTIHQMLKQQAQPPTKP